MILDFTTGAKIKNEKLTFYSVYFFSFLIPALLIFSPELFKHSLKRNNLTNRH